MSFLIVSGLRLARRREIVSLPPEKMCSTATADPIKKKIDINIKHGQEKKPGMERMSRARRERFGNCVRRPYHHRTGSQLAKSSCERFQNSESSSTAARFRWNLAVKSFFRELLGFDSSVTIDKEDDGVDGRQVD